LECLQANARQNLIVESRKVLSVAKPGSRSERSGKRADKTMQDNVAVIVSREVLGGVAHLVVDLPVVADLVVDLLAVAKVVVAKVAVEIRESEPVRRMNRLQSGGRGGLMDHHLRLGRSLLSIAVRCESVVRSLGLKKGRDVDVDVGSLVDNR